MSTINTFYFLLFMIILFQVSLTGGSVEYSQSSIEDMKASLFNTQKEQIYYVGKLITKKIIGFSDLDNDKYTDIISYERKDKDEDENYNFTFYENIYDKRNKKFKDEVQQFSIIITKNRENETIKDVTVRNLQVFNCNKKKACALVSFNDGKDKLLHYISEFEMKEVNETNRLKDITSNILILNRDEDKKMRLLFADEEEIKICYLDDQFNCEIRDFKELLTDPTKININKGKLSLKGGLGYVDLSANCIPDIILSFENNGTRTIEIFTSNKNGTFTYNTNITLNSEEYGAFAIVNINDGKSGNKLPYLGLLIPNIIKGKVFYFINQGNAHYKWSTLYCDSPKDSEAYPFFDQFNKKNYSLSIEGEEDSPLDNTYNTVIRVGDFRGTSNPGIMVKQKKDGKEQISLYERKSTDFKYYTGIDINKINETEKVTMGLFFDIDEAGTLSFIIQTESGNNYFFFNYRRNIYFIKSKLMNDKEKYYDINLGTTYRYIVTDKKGNRHMDVGFQLAQTSDMNIPVPYGIMGLDDTNNYIEYFQTISGNVLLRDVSFERSDEKNYKGNSPVIPNTQMMISKYYKKEKKIEWNVDLIVQPMEQIWLFLVVVIIVLIIVLGIIIYLHLKEVKEEQKETNKFKSWFA